MTSGRFSFDRFHLDAANRQLFHSGNPVELNGRYFDALALLVREQGKLVSKDRFLQEVWRGVPVTDEALTQCIRTLRRQLGDNAARPHFIETVPKYGYRFIAPVQAGDEERPLAEGTPPITRRDMLPLGLAGTAAGGVAGVIGGILYGLVAAQSLQPAMGAVSILLVLTAVTGMIGVIGGAGVGFGIAAASGRSSRAWQADLLGGAAGGLLVGAAVKLIGLDAFTLLLGQTPAGITGAGEGGLLGGIIGLAFWAGTRKSISLRRIAVTGGAAGVAAGLLITLLGGQLLGGSLDHLTASFPDARLRLDALGKLFGESGFGPVTRTVTAALEAGLFSSFLLSAMVAVWRKRPS